MSTSYYSDVAVGFEVHDSDFFTVTSGDKKICPRGHTGKGRYCSECGQALKPRAVQEPTPGLLALCADQGLDVPDDLDDLYNTWLDTKDVLYQTDIDNQPIPGGKRYYVKGLSHLRTESMTTIDLESIPTARASLLRVQQQLQVTRPILLVHRTWAC